MFKQTIIPLSNSRVFERSLYVPPTNLHGATVSKASLNTLQRGLLSFGDYVFSVAKSLHYYMIWDAQKK